MVIPRHGTHSLDDLTPEAETLLRLIPNASCLTGVEVGTLRGRTATLLLSRRPGLLLYCVDNFDCEDIVGYEPPEAVRDAFHDNSYPWGLRCRLIDQRSIEAAENYGHTEYSPVNIPGHVSHAWGNGEPFDFVYLDAKHDLDSVTEDIVAWWPHVREGGMLCGHDYGKMKPPWVKGRPWRVNSAVDAFVAGEDLELRVDGVVWWVMKPIVDQTGIAP